MQPPTSGEIRIDGRPVDRSRRGLKTLRRQAQLVFQDPTGSLNPRQTIYEIVAEGPRIHRLLLDLVRHEDVTVLVVTHDLGLARNIADRIAVMNLGRIVEIGPAADLLESPQHPYTRALLSVVPEARQMEQEILTGEAPDPRRIPAGCRFHPHCPLLRDGQAEVLGVAGVCQSQDVALAPTAVGRAVACHAVALSHHP